MAIPDREKNHRTDTQYMRELMEKINKSQVWVADKTGISRRRIQYLLVGTKEFAGEIQDVKLTYCEQFILEALAEQASQCDPQRL